MNIQLIGEFPLTLSRPGDAYTHAGRQAGAAWAAYPGRYTTACGLDLDPAPVSERILHITCPACVQALYGTTPDAPNTSVLTPEGVDIAEWCREIIEGGAGMNVYEEREVVTWPKGERIGAAEWTIRCLANPGNEGSADVLAAIIERRQQVARERGPGWADKLPALIAAGPLGELLKKAIREAYLRKLEPEVDELLREREVLLAEIAGMQAAGREAISLLRQVEEGMTGHIDAGQAMYKPQLMTQRCYLQQAMDTVTNIQAGTDWTDADAQELKAFWLLNGIVHDTRSRGGQQAPDYLIHARNVLRWKTVDGNPPEETKGTAPTESEGQA